MDHLDRMTFKYKSTLNILALCLIWAVIIIGFQHVVSARLKLARPDDALSWTAASTMEDPFEKVHSEGAGFYNFYRSEHAAWDSGFYLSIATAGYEDPVMSRVTITEGKVVSKNYAFMPVYPLLIKTVNYFLSIIPLLPETELPVYAGILVSFLGMCVGAFSIFEIVKLTGGNEHDGFMSVFYMLIFPTSFFGLQVYTEGLFIGLSFACLAMIRQKNWLAASTLVAIAFLTRIVGIGLFLPLAIALINDMRISNKSSQLIYKVTSLLVPLAVILAWYFSPLGENFFLVEKNFFGRQVLSIQSSISIWLRVISKMGLNPETTVYFSLEFAGIALALFSCLLTMRRFQPEAIFGIAVILISVFSSIPQSMLRYMMVIPNIYLLLGMLGRNKIFDRVWTLVSILILGVQITLFTFDMWVG